MLARIHARRASLDRVLAFTIRHRVKPIDLAFARAALLIAGCPRFTLLCLTLAAVNSTFLFGAIHRGLRRLLKATDEAAFTSSATSGERP